MTETKKLAEFELLKFRFGTTRECSDSVLYFGSEAGKLTKSDSGLDSEEEEEEEEEEEDREDHHH